MRLAAACVAALVATQGHAACVPGDGAWIAQACYSGAGEAVLYGHGVLGDTPEWAALTVTYGPEGQAVAGQATVLVSFPDGIFEDIAPRLADIDGDGRPEAVVVHSSYTMGARIAVIGFDPGPVIKAATPHIGQRNRWFSPVGIADLDGDGTVEVAYIDRPHLAKTLRVWTYDAGAFREMATLPGVTNHQIGEDTIAGGIRDCGAGPEMVVATADWSRLFAVTLQSGTLTPRDIGAHGGRESFAAALAC